MMADARGRVLWSADLLVIDSDEPLREALRRIRAALAGKGPPWLVIRRHHGLYLYAFRPEELLAWPPLREAFDQGVARLDWPLEEVLQLHEEHSSPKIEGAEPASPDELPPRLTGPAPSSGRWLRVNSVGQVLAVGAQDLPIHRAGRSRSRGATPSAPGASGDRSAPGWAGSAPPEAMAGPALESAPEPEASSPFMAPDDAPVPSSPPVSPPALEDEGTTPIRHPSIDVDRALAPGVVATLTVDLLMEAVAHTQGGPLAIGTLAADWSALPITVHLQCPALEIEPASAVVTIRRNAASQPARFSVRLRADAAPGPCMVMANFWHDTRFCGAAVRLFHTGQASTDAAASTPAKGLVAVEPAAQAPDLTVHISRLEAEKLGPLPPKRAATATADDRPVYLRWLVVTPRFDGLPARLEEDIRLPRDPAAEASALFKEFAVLERGKHVRPIEGFGSRLWQMAPPMFRAVYWALWDRHRRPLTIQFISDEPHLPWELMRPARDDDSELHPPLALGHAVARWIKRFDGYMRNHLPGGRICTVAPKYGAGRALKRAQQESQRLVDEFQALKKEGTRDAVLGLLETAPPPEPLAVLHFAGHGKFAPQVASHSAIKLEDGDLLASEVERPEVRLGRACRTLVFFNACEVGAAGAVFGEVGGWADAFLGRQFGGFVAPLWSVDDEDAGTVAAELLEQIVRRHAPIGEALRQVRAAHGTTSPTFYSYLYYGDVTARFSA